VANKRRFGLHECKDKQVMVLDAIRRRNACLRHYRLTGLVTTLTFDL